MLRQASAGLVWSKQMYPYDVGRWLDGDPGARRAARGAPPRSQQRLASPRLLRRARDARSVGVPVVRRVGPRLPRGALGTPRPGVREVPAPRPAPRVVHAPERRAARLRVELRRRESAGTRDGGPARLSDRREPRPGVPRARVPEAARELLVVGQPPGRRRQQRLRRRLPRPGQHQPGRPLDAARGRHARAGGRHRVDGVLHGCRCS